MEEELRERRENAPENLYYSEMYETLESQCDLVEDALNSLREAVE